MCLLIDVIARPLMLAYVIISTVVCRPWPADASIAEYKHSTYARRLARRHNFTNLSSKVFSSRTILLVGAIVTATNPSVKGYRTLLQGLDQQLTSGSII
jgi:hypothetical protein